MKNKAKVLGFHAPRQTLACVLPPPLSSLFFHPADRGGNLISFSMHLGYKLREEGQPQGSAGGFGGVYGNQSSFCVTGLNGDLGRGRAG